MMISNGLLLLNFQSYSSSELCWNNRIDYYCQWGIYINLFFLEKRGIDRETNLLTCVGCSPLDNNGEEQGESILGLITKWLLHKKFEQNPLLFVILLICWSCYSCSYIMRQRCLPEKIISRALMKRWCSWRGETREQTSHGRTLLWRLRRTTVNCAVVLLLESVSRLSLHVLFWRPDLPVNACLSFVVKKHVKKTTVTQERGMCRRCEEAYKTGVCSIVSGRSWREGMHLKDSRHRILWAKWTNAFDRRFTWRWWRRYTMCSLNVSASYFTRRADSLEFFHRTFIHTKRGNRCSVYRSRRDCCRYGLALLILFMNESLTKREAYSCWQQWLTKKAIWVPLSERILVLLCIL